MYVKNSVSYFFLIFIIFFSGYSQLNHAMSILSGLLRKAYFFGGASSGADIKPVIFDAVPHENDAGNDIITIILYNCNVPLKSIEIKDIKNNLNKGRSVSDKKALWHIDVDLKNSPFEVLFVAYGNKYSAHIESFWVYQQELGLIERQTPRGPEVILKVLEEASYPESFIDSVVLPLKIVKD